jgi:hypothetical protein
MKWPATMDELEQAGYGYTGLSKECDCGTTFLWFITPNRKWMPVSALKDSRLVEHHTVCERVKQFRAAAKGYRDRTEPKKPVQTELFGEKT